MSEVPPRQEGLDAVNAACRQLYPEQRNPRQITALVKFWLGGPDPLDYISIYSNRGDGSQNIPAHWHYVSCGLSDLYGDSRVHEVAAPGQVSGFGFELTFRVKREREDGSPPVWPAALMQALARYVFHSGNALCGGDHVSWHCSLDNSKSPLQHMLLAEDPQLAPINTSLGSVCFVQIVAATAEELQAAQRWNGAGVIQLMRKDASTGGEWLVCDMQRQVSVFEDDSSAQTVVEEGWEHDGSNLSGVSTACDWREMEEEGGAREEKEEDGGNVRGISQLHLQLTIEAAALLPLAIKGRLAHHRHFTFKSVSGEKAVTLVTDGVDGAFADEHQPFSCQDSWLQVYCSEQFSRDLLHSLQPILNEPLPALPVELSWHKYRLTLTIVPQSAT